MKTVDLQWPSGVGRRLGVRVAARGGREGYLAPWSLNVRLEDSITDRLRGGNFTGQDPSAAGDPVYFNLVTENGDNIVTENGDAIVLGPRYEVTTGHDRVYVTAGDDAPSSGSADCLYRGRLFRVSDNVIFTSRQGDTTDWDYGGNEGDTGRATSFQLSQAEEIGDDVIALVPHKDSYLLCFTATSTWILTGDPTTGTLRNVSREVGIIAARAWCKNHDTAFFLSSQGLYSIGADGSGLRPVSENVIPEDLTGVDDDDAVMDYYHTDRGVYIHLTDSPSWFYDTERDQFWPFDTTETDSHVLIGPIKLGSIDVLGMIQTIHGIMAQGSSTVAWKIIPGDTAEEAAANGKAAITAALAGNDYSSYVRGSGSWSAGRSHTERPRITSMYACLWLSSESDWAYEGITLNILPHGRWRS